jgi:hypothetical protein
MKNEDDGRETGEDLFCPRRAGTFPVGKVKDVPLSPAAAGTFPRGKVRTETSSAAAGGTFPVGKAKDVPLSPAAAGTFPRGKVRTETSSAAAGGTFPVGKVIELCKPCLMEMRRRGRKLKEVTGGTRKITCWLCDRRRYGNEYILEDRAK